MDPRPEESLVGVDVPHPRDPPLVEQKGLDRRAPTPCEGAQRVDRKFGRQRLDAETSREVVLQRRVAEQHDARAETARIDEQHAVPVIEADSHPQIAAFVRILIGVDQQQVARSCAGA